MKELIEETVIWRSSILIPRGLLLKSNTILHTRARWLTMLRWVFSCSMCDLLDQAIAHQVRESINHSKSRFKSSLAYPWPNLVLFSPSELEFCGMSSKDITIPLNGASSPKVHRSRAENDRKWRNNEVSNQTPTLPAGPRASERLRKFANDEMANQKEQIQVEPSKSVSFHLSTINNNQTQTSSNKKKCRSVKIRLMIYASSNSPISDVIRVSRRVVVKSSFIAWHSTSAVEFTRQTSRQAWDRMLVFDDNALPITTKEFSFFLRQHVDDDGVTMAENEAGLARNQVWVPFLTSLMKTTELLL